MKNTNHGCFNGTTRMTTKGTVSPVRIGKRYDGTTKKVWQARRYHERELIQDRARREASKTVNFLWRAGEKKKVFAASLCYAIDNTTVNCAPSGPDDLAGRILYCRFFNILRPILPPQALIAIGSAFIYLFPFLSIFSFSTHLRTQSAFDRVVGIDR